MVNVLVMIDSTEPEVAVIIPGLGDPASKGGLGGNLTGSAYQLHWTSCVKIGDGENCNAYQFSEA